jgi:hypothetical protein
MNLGFDSDLPRELRKNEEIIVGRILRLHVASQ